jgi:RNA polymerase sigma factor (sigma-70 family)
MARWRARCAWAAAPFSQVDEGSALVGLVPLFSRAHFVRRFPAGPAGGTRRSIGRAAARIATYNDADSAAAVTYQQLLVENLELIERLVRFVARRRHLSFSDTEEFASIVRLKFVEQDFAILRKFEGRSTLGTYLTVVIERLCQDFSIARWGKWRPSAAARRMGEVAVLLEQMVLRDGVTFDEAVGTLQTNHGVSETRQQLWEMFLLLPTRSARWGGVPSADGVPADRFADPSFRSQEDQTEGERVSGALSEAVASLSPEDQRLLQLRFEENLTIAEISAAMGVEPRMLYRRLQVVIRGLRASLEAQGVSHADTLRLVGHPTMLLRRVLPDIRRA